MKVLQLCNKPPFPPVDGGTLAMNSITQGLLSAGCEVKVLSVCSDKHPVLKERMPEEYLKTTRFESVYVDLGIHPLDAAVAMLCGESYHVKRFVSREFASKLAQILRDEEFDVVHVESIFLSPYVPVIRKHSKAPIFLRAHNVENLIWRKVALGERNLWKRWYMKHSALTLGVYEREHLNDYDGVVSITDCDADELRKMGCRKPMVTIPFSITPVALSQEEQDGTLFHLGSMDWLPNQEGIRWFLSKVWPIVHERMPRLTLYLAGRKMPADLMKLDMVGVKIVGEVPDAMHFIGSKQINVVPLLSGSGIRVKIIEAMSAGKAVVSTTVGAQGIPFTDGENLLIADSPEQFADQIQRCVEDKAFRIRLGENARRFVCETYSSEMLTKKLLAFYEKHLNLE